MGPIFTQPLLLDFPNFLKYKSFLPSSDSSACTGYINKADIESGSLYILLSKFLSLSLMSPRRGSEKKKQMTLGLSGSSDLKVKRYGGGGVLIGGSATSGKCICAYVFVFL